MIFSAGNFCTRMYKCFVGFYNARAHWSKAGGVWRTAHWQLMQSCPFSLEIVRGEDSPVF